MTGAWDPLADEDAAGTFVTDVESGAPCVRRVVLRVVEGPDKGLAHELDVGTRIVGTHKDAALRLSDPQVSRRHVELALVDDGVRVVDLGSKNGVFHGNARITQAVVAPGERLTLGSTVIALESVDEPLPLGDGLARFGALAAQSPAMRRVLALVARAARSSATVLLEGETGVGKDVLARTLHDEGARAKGPFLVFDCASVSPTVLASELFGHKRGAFTGADDDRAGVFEAARGGSVFLDEVGELPLELQPTLLRVLESRQVRRLGENTARDVDVRVLAATNRALKSEVEGGRFRRDLYFRLAIIRIGVPPLRDRREDIVPLAERFLEHHGVDKRALSARDRQRLMRGEWPGNVRELRNVIEQSVALSAGAALELVGLDGEGSPPPKAVQAAPDDGRARPLAPSLSPTLDEGLWSLPFKDARAAALASFERLYVERLLERTGGNVSRAASTAEIDRNYLYRLMRRHGKVRAKG